MKAYFFTDDQLDDEDLYFIMHKIFQSRLRPKTALPKQHLPISDDDIVRLAKNLNLSIDGFRKIMTDNQ